MNTFYEYMSYYMDFSEIQAVLVVIIIFIIMYFSKREVHAKKDFRVKM